MVLLAAANGATTNSALLTLAALLGIATVVLLITWGKLHPFLALILGSGVLGVVAGMSLETTVDSFTDGVGDTVGSVGLLIALGAMVGKLLADSGGATTIVDTVVDRVSGRRLPWAMAGVAALIGIPLFFEVGVVLLVPIVVLAARRAHTPVLRIGIPALAGLSVLHGLVPPHPGPLVAIDALKADLGLTLLFGLIAAVPSVILAGPVYGQWISRRVLLADETEPAREPVAAAARSTGPAGAAPTPSSGAGVIGAGDPAEASGPSFSSAVLVVLLPVVLMLARAIGELTLSDGSTTRTVLDTIGTPVIALLAGVLLAVYLLGHRTGMSRARISESLGSGLPPVAGVLLIVAAGGGFKQTLVDAGVGDLVAHWAEGAHVNALLLGWLVAVGIRLATGSATVATITAAGIVSPLAASLDRPEVALLALAVGAGSLFFSHVNDAGFWLVKEYFGMSVGQTLKTWSVMETIISVVGLGMVLLIHVVV